MEEAEAARKAERQARIDSVMEVRSHTRVPLARWGDRERMGEGGGGGAGEDNKVYRSGKSGLVF